MMDFLNFTFESFWHFVGMVVLLSIAVGGVVGFGQALRGRS